MKKKSLLQVELPPPDCPYGYTKAQLEEIFGPKDGKPGHLTMLYDHLYGSTGVLCTGEQYNHETKEHEPSLCADNPHGPVTYRCDLETFIEGLLPLD